MTRNERNGSGLPIGKRTARKGESEMPDLSRLVPILAFVFVFFIYFFDIQLRRLKYTQIAEELRAEYQSQGLFKSGGITGSSNNREYSIETREVGRGRGSSFRTTLSIRCAYKGIPLQMEGGFFKTFPNWKYAYTVGDRKERVFVTEITLQNALVRLEEKYKLQVQGLFQEIAFLYPDLLKKGYMKIQQGQVSFTTHGVLKNLAMARQMIAVLAKVADRIETNWGCPLG